MISNIIEYTLIYRIIEEQRRPVYTNPNLHIVFGITLTGILGVSSVTPAFPGIAREMGLSTQQVALLVTAFTLPGIVLSPVLGILADRMGRKNVIVPSLLLFGFAGFACSLAPSFHFLLGMRFLQGMGASALGSLNAALISDMFEGNERITAMGYNFGVLSIGATVYPAIGGALALLGWQYPFYLPLVGIPVGLLVMFKLQANEPENHQSLYDYFLKLGYALKQPRLLSLFVASILSFILLYGPILTYLPFFIEESFGSDSLVIGTIVSMVAITNGLSSGLLGRLTLRFNEVNLLKASYLFYAAAFFMIPFIHWVWLLLLPVLLYGWGQGTNLPNILNQISRQAPAETRGAVLAINGMVLRTGQTLGPIIIGLFYTYYSFQGVYWISAAMAFAAFLIMAITPLITYSGGN